MQLHYNELIASLAQRIDEVLKSLVPSGGTCALLDFPNHGNVDDNAIWLGEKAYLRSINDSVVFTSDIGTYVPAMSSELVKRGHKITVVTLSDRLDHDERID